MSRDELLLRHIGENPTGAHVFPPGHGWILLHRNDSFSTPPPFPQPFWLNPRRRALPQILADFVRGPVSFPDAFRQNAFLRRKNVHLTYSHNLALTWQVAHQHEQLVVRNAENEGSKQVGGWVGGQASDDLRHLHLSSLNHSRSRVRCLARVATIPAVLKGGLCQHQYSRANYEAGCYTTSLSMKLKRKNCRCISHSEGGWGGQKREAFVDAQHQLRISCAREERRNVCVGTGLRLKSTPTTKLAGSKKVIACNSPGLAEIRSVLMGLPVLHRRCWPRKRIGTSGA